MTQKLRTIKKKCNNKEEIHDIKSIVKKPENYIGLFAMHYFITKDKSLRQEKGITLIALVVTIIVLLILSGVTISMLTGQNGILTRTAKANFYTEMSAIEENKKIKEESFRSMELLSLFISSARLPFIFLLSQKEYPSRQHTAQRKQYSH